jgi:hypothetical protein
VDKVEGKVVEAAEGVGLFGALGSKSGIEIGLLITFSSFPLGPERIADTPAALHHSAKMTFSPRIGSIRRYHPSKIQKKSSTVSTVSTRTPLAATTSSHSIFRLAFSPSRLRLGSLWSCLPAPPPPLGPGGITVHGPHPSYPSSLPTNVPAHHRKNQGTQPTLISLAYHLPLFGHCRSASRSRSL